MKTPNMILFDCGHTLLCEPGFDFLRGHRALHPYIQTNPDSLSAEQIHDFASKLFAQFGAGRAHGMELHERQFQRMLYQSLGIALSVSYEEAEQIQWDAISPGALMPDADRIIDCVNRLGIRSGVVSNIGWSGAALKKRIDRLLPRNRFSFVIASSEYGFRKPSPYLFGLALRKAGLPPGEVWFCGDNPQADIEGAARAGMVPVWYDNDWEREDRDGSHIAPPACEHLRVREWGELIRLLEGLRE